MKSSEQPTAKLFHYVLIAVSARVATGATAVAVVLLANFHGADGLMAGSFAACLTFPHVFGPIFGRQLEKSINPIRIIGIACIMFSALFQIVVISIEHQAIYLSFVTLLLCGACSSFMMGGLSTQLNAFTPNSRQYSKFEKQRHAQSWDNATYGIGLTIGPLLTGVLSQMYTIPIAVSALMCLPVASAVLLILISQKVTKNTEKNGPVPNIKQVVNIICASLPLKRTMLITTSASFSLAALPVMAVYLGKAWQQSQENGAYLVTFYGLGCLCGSGFLLLKPFTADALKLLKSVGIALLVSLVFLTFIELFTLGFGWGSFSYWFCGVVNSLFFAATIAARTEYAPKQGASQIYMWVAAVKITAASIGALIAGVMVDINISLPFILSSLSLALGLLACFYKIKRPN